MKTAGLSISAAILLLIVFIGWGASSLPERGTTDTVSADLRWLGPSDKIASSVIDNPTVQDVAGYICQDRTGNMKFEHPTIIFASSPSDLQDEGVCTEYRVSEPYAALKDGAAQSQAPHPDPPFHGPIKQASKAYQVDYALIRAIIMAESNNMAKKDGGTGPSQYRIGY